MRNKPFVESDWEREYLADSLFILEEEEEIEKEFWEEQGKIVVLQSDETPLILEYDNGEFQANTRERV